MNTGSTEATDARNRAGRGRLVLPCRRRVEDLWLLVTDAGTAPIGLREHTVGCRYCGPELARLRALVQATSAMRDAPSVAPEGFLDRVMAVISTELRSGPDLPLLAEPAQAWISASAVLAVVRSAVSGLAADGAGPLLRHSAVTAAGGTRPAIDLELRVELPAGSDETDWRGRIVAAVLDAVEAEIGLQVDDLELELQIGPEAGR